MELYGLQPDFGCHRYVALIVSGRRWHRDCQCLCGGRALWLLVFMGGYCDNVYGGDC